MSHNNSQKKEVVIITGSSGLIGGQLMRRLRHEFCVVGFDRDGEPQPPCEIECVCVDLTSDESVTRGLERVRYAYGNRIASVVHLAAYYDFSGEPSPLYEEVTVKGTERLLNGLQDFDVEQFIFSSTMLVHEPGQPGSPISEETPLDPKWEYPKSKKRTEERIHDKHGDIPVLTLRIAGVYTDECDSPPLAEQMRRIYEARITSRVFPGDTTHGQAFIHLHDLLAAIEAAIARRESLPPETVLLIGESQTYSYGFLQRAFGKLLAKDSDWRTEEIPKSVAKSGAWIQGKIPGIEEPFIKPWMIDLADDHYELDIARARELLLWTPKQQLIDALPRMAEALLKDPKAWYRRHGFDPSMIDADAASIGETAHV